MHLTDIEDSLYTHWCLKPTNVLLIQLIYIVFSVFLFFRFSSFSFCDFMCQLSLFFYQTNINNNINKKMLLERACEQWYLNLHLEGGGAHHPQRRARWRSGESWGSQGSVSKQGVTWMYLMMVTNGENMARKLSRTVFIQGTCTHIYLPLAFSRSFSIYVWTSIPCSTNSSLAFLSYTLFLFLNLAVGSYHRYTIFFLFFGNFFGASLREFGPEKLAHEIQIRGLHGKPKFLNRWETRRG